MASLMTEGEGDAAGESAVSQGLPHAITSGLTVAADRPTIDYFKQFPGLDAGPGYEGPGYWELPIPVMKPIDVDLKDVVIYDGDGYPALRAQQSAYTIKQLNDYAQGARYAGASDKNPASPNGYIMATIAKRLTPEDIRNLASYLQGIR